MSKPDQLTLFDDRNADADVARSANAGTDVISSGEIFPIYELFDWRNMRVLKVPAPRRMTPEQLEQSNNHYRSAKGVWRPVQSRAYVVKRAINDFRGNPAD